MLFNSIDFAIFLPIVFIIYWFVVNKNLKAQNLFIFIASYVFYGWWDWKFLILIGITSLASWLSGIFILKIRENFSNEESNKEKKYSRIVTASNIILNLGILGFLSTTIFLLQSLPKPFLCSV